jgi:DNA helicase-2/ATP-dependent DNA helicase PcrA
VSGAPKKKLAAFADLMTALRKKAGELGPRDVLEAVLEDTGYAKSLEMEDTAEADARLENLQELLSSLDDYEAEARAAGEAPSLEGYLERVTLQSDVDAMKDAPRVTLMTVHGAKGLEFEVVALTGMEEEMFPYRGLDPGERDELEEERRLAYVAITRARHKLVMTHAQTRQIFGQTRYGRPSRFLGDLPKGVFEHKTTAAIGSPRERYIDRAPASVAVGPWRHPQAVSFTQPSAPEPGQQFVDHDFFDDAPDDGGSEVPLRRGSRVLHKQFGEGEVRAIENIGEPRVVAYFPGWGEKKILARFLKLA